MVYCRRCGKITFRIDFVPAKTRLGGPPQKHMKKNLEIFGRCFLFVCTVYKRLHTKKNSNSPSNFCFTYVKMLYFTLYYTIGYCTLHLVYRFTVTFKSIKIIVLLILWPCKATENIEGSCITREDRNKMHLDRYASY